MDPKTFDSIIPMAKMDVTEAEINAVIAVLQSGQFSQGEKVQEFEEQFAKKVGSLHAVAVASGTAALHLAYLALLEPGSEVLVPTFTHISTASMVFYANCRPVLCDLDPHSFLIDLSSAEQQLTPKTKAIAPVHLFGNVCDIEKIQLFAKKYKLKIIWDAAQAHGAQYNGLPIGGIADATAYSFYPTKNMTTGEGGMITTNDADLAVTLRLLRSHGQTKKYYHPSLGVHYRMSELNAAMGLAQLEKLDNYNLKRQYNAAYLNHRFKDLKAIHPQRIAENVLSVFHQYTLYLDLPKLRCTRDEFVSALNQVGIATAIHYPRPLHQQPAIIEKNGPKELPVAEDLSTKVLSLPIHPMLTEEDLAYIGNAVTALYEKNLVSS